MFDTGAARSLPRPGHLCLLDTPDARSRLVATTTMASTLAHEVNQPLSAAVNYMHACASRLRSRGEGYEDLLAMIEDASRETLKAGEIIRRMRSFIVTGKIAGRRENLRTMIERVTALALPAGADVEIVTSIPLTHFVIADRIQIEQVFANLLHNACEALQGCAQRRIAIGAMQLGEDIVVRIEDSGRGLPVEGPERIFEPDFTTKAKGPGLGLPISKTIVEAHGGRIWADNIKSGGSAFNVALPAAYLPAQQQAG